MALTELVQTFREALIALVPIVEVTGVRWKRWEAYDGWDRIEEALFKSMVSDATVAAFDEGAVFALPLINNTNFDAGTESLLFDEDFGPEYRLLGLTHGSAPFDTLRFIATDQGGSQRDLMEKRLTCCRLAAVAKLRVGRGSKLSRVGRVG